MIEAGIGAKAYYDGIQGLYSGKVTKIEEVNDRLLGPRVLVTITFDGQMIRAPLAIDAKPLYAEGEELTEGVRYIVPARALRRAEFGHRIAEYTWVTP